MNDKTLIEQIKELIEEISFTFFSQNLQLEKAIDLKQEEKVKQLIKLAKEAGLCPICMTSAKIIPLMNFGTEEHPIIMCHSCAYTEKR